MKKLNINRDDLIFFISLGCSNPELAEVFSCSVRTIANRKVEEGLIGLTNNNSTTKIVNGARECVRCGKIKNIKQFNKQSSASSGYRSTCKSCQSKEGKEYYKENKRELSNKHREYYEGNKNLYAEKDARRRASKKRATPTWYSELDKFIFTELKDLCKRRKEIFNIDYEIDHIIPLQNDKVCGLHYYQNWQLLSRSENRKKGNRHDL